MTIENTITSFTLSWSVLADLSTVATCASTDTSRPVLNYVRVTTDGTRVKFTATDSYTLAMATAELADGVIREMLIPARALADFLRTAKPLAREIGRSTVLIEAIDGYVTLSAYYGDALRGSAQYAAAPEGVTYPNVDSVIPSPESYACELGAFSPDFLARMAKIVPAKPTGYWECVSMSRTSPSIWKHDARGVEALFVITPVRVR